MNTNLPKNRDELIVWILENGKSSIMHGMQEPGTLISRETMIAILEYATELFESCPESMSVNVRTGTNGCDYFVVQFHGHEVYTIRKKMHTDTTYGVIAKQLSKSVIADLELLARRIHNHVLA